VFVEWGLPIGGATKQHTHMPVQSTTSDGLVCRQLFEKPRETFVWADGGYEMSAARIPGGTHMRVCPGASRFVTGPLGAASRGGSKTLAILFFNQTNNQTKPTTRSGVFLSVTPDRNQPNIHNF